MVTVFVVNTGLCVASGTVPAGLASSFLASGFVAASGALVRDMVTGPSGRSGRHPSPARSDALETNRISQVIFVMVVAGLVCAKVLNTIQDFFMILVLLFSGRCTLRRVRPREISRDHEAEFVRH